MNRLPVTTTVFCHDQMTLREKIRVALVFAGIVLLMSGAAVGCSEENKETDTYTFKVGAWKDGGVAAGVPREVVPWLLVGGVITIMGGFAFRD